MDCKLLLFSFLLVFVPARLQADDLSDSQIENRINTSRVAPLEGAGAHGIAGFRFGAGLLNAPASGSELKDQLTAAKVWVTKGLFYPFDVGLSLSYGNNHPDAADSLGGYVQWTFFEKLATPAFALRAGSSKTWGPRDEFTMRSSFGSALVSWGLFFITAYGELGLHKHDYDYVISDEVFGDQKTETVATVGLQLQVLPPFIQLAFERAASSLSRSAVYQGKLSIGL